MMNPALVVLTLGNFTAGTGALLVTGLLDSIASGVSVSIQAAGQLTTAFAISVAIFGPLLATLTSKLDRRTALTAALVVFAAGCATSAMAADYYWLLASRVLTGIGASLYTPQAAASAALLVPPEQRGRAITTVFGGFIFATVFGVPIGTYLGAMFGWREAFAVVVGVALLNAAVLWRVMPPKLMAPKVDLSAWGQILRSPGLMLLIATTGLQICGQLTFFVYLAPYFKTSLALTTAGVGWLFMWYGLANLVGNTVVARNIDRVGAARLSNLGIVITAAAMAAFLFGWGSLALTMLLLALWGTASFAINSGMQTRLVGAAPWLAPAALPLNSTSIYLGQAAGAAIGGWLVSHDHLRSLPWVGAVFVVIAGLTSWAATRQPAPIKR